MSGLPTDYKYSPLFFAGQTYVDYAGAALYTQSQLDAYFRDLQDNVYGNPHSGNLVSSLTADVVEQVRHR